MPEPGPPARRGRGRRPIAQVREEVLEAAAEILMREGVGGFTMDKVIVRSGVSSATVYRHWPSRGALALDGYVHAVGDEIALRDTGDIRADLLHVIAAFVRMVNQEPAGPVFAQLIGAAQTDVELAAQFDEHYFGPRRRQAFTLLEAAKARGQIRPEADPGVIVDLIWGACYIRLLLPHLTDTLTVDFARDVVHQSLKGLTTPGAGD
ncbi:TetR/AcrR family transcriptional regulator [Streptomyces sp. BpilaLS-43]|uniref:TetR/AcrR family transcriptional regulator n=1 Tax=Streptomyces sp. BpilaLS-43 TaxID=1839778 RepID=UPI000AF8BAD3|nr:TetR/AcrR family transcriptional regulator [Streptomyces sp. BpilaLS-43]